jgi:hypothetical protein
MHRRSRCLKASEEIQSFILKYTVLDPFTIVKQPRNVPVYFVLKPGSAEYWIEKIKSFAAFDHLKEKIAEMLQSRKNL